MRKTVNECEEKLADGTYQVPSVVRLFRLLEALANRPEGMTFPELVGAMDFPKSAVFRMCETLTALGYAEKGLASDKYTLTRKMLALGNASICRYDLIETARPFLARLRDLTNETAQLNTRIGSEGVVVDTLPSRQAIRTVVDPGTRFGLHCSSAGKVFLAWMAPGERERVLARLKLVRYTPTTITDPRALAEHLEKVRRQGYAVDDAEGEADGLRCVSCPVLDARGEVVAALTVNAPASRMSVAAMRKIAGQIRPLAEELSARLGYRILEGRASAPRQ